MHTISWTGSNLRIRLDSADMIKSVNVTNAPTSVNGTQQEKLPSMSDKAFIFVEFVHFDWVTEELKVILWYVL